MGTLFAANTRVITGDGKTVLLSDYPKTLLGPNRTSVPISISNVVERNLSSLDVLGRIIHTELGVMPICNSMISAKACKLNTVSDEYLAGEGYYNNVTTLDCVNLPSTHRAMKRLGILSGEIPASIMKNPAFLAGILDNAMEYEGAAGVGDDADKIALAMTRNGVAVRDVMNGTIFFNADSGWLNIPLAEKVVADDVTEYKYSYEAEAVEVTFTSPAYVGPGLWR